jgi:hypothetical protein
VGGGAFAQGLRFFLTSNAINGDELLDTRLGENRLVAAPKASTKSSTGAVARHSHWRLFAVEGVGVVGASLPG